MNVDNLNYFCLTVCLIATLYESLLAEDANKFDKTTSNVQNITSKIVTYSNKTQTHMTDIPNTIQAANTTGLNESEVNVTATEKRIATTTRAPMERKLPIPIMIASPAVAVGIVIFICVAYKAHTMQLNAQAKDLALQVAAEQCSSPCMPCSPSQNTQTLLPPSHSMNSNSPSHSNSDLLGARRKSLRTPSPTLLAPPDLGSHRGSTWSALSDQEIVSHSPRRHSTFLL